MDLARLLAPCEELDVANESTQKHKTKCLTVARRPARVRRKLKSPLERLREQLQAYEYVVANLQSVLDQRRGEEPRNADGDDDDDDASTRMRAHLQRTIELYELARHEKAVKSELLRMVRVKHDNLYSLRKLMRGIRVDEWHWVCERLRLLTLEHFEPYPHERCHTLVAETIRAIRGYKLPKSARENGFSLFGWRDTQGMDAEERFVHFATRKTFCSSQLEEAVALSWRGYQDRESFQQLVMSESMQLHYEVLQHVTPDIMIVQMVENYPGLDVFAHSISIICRVQTDRGYVIAVRTIPCPRLQAVMRSEGLCMTGSFFWSEWVVTERNADDECIEFHMTFAGYIGAEHPAYAKRWVTEVLLALLRAEAKVMGTQMVSLPEANDAR